MNASKPTGELEQLDQGLKPIVLHIVDEDLPAELEGRRRFVISPIIRVTDEAMELFEKLNARSAGDEQ